MGVDLFFVISGFVMVLTSGSLFDADGPRVFGARRVARIVPAYWIATFAQAATYYAIGLGAVVTVEGMLTSLFFLPINHATTMVGVGWSLNSEMFFYLLFACALPLGRSRAVLVLSLLMTAFAVLGRSVPMPLPFSFWANSILIEFVFGMLLGLAYVQGIRLPAWIAGCLMIVGLGLFILSASSGYYVGALQEAPSPRPLHWGVPALLVVAGAVFAPEPRQHGRGLKFLVLLGDASYCIYLAHVMVITGMIRLPWGDHYYIMIAAMVFATLVVSIIAHLTIERRLTEMTKRLLLPRSSRAPAVAEAALAR